jgi:hypothetical protein
LAGREDLVDWLEVALRSQGGSATIVEVCEHVWRHRERDLRDSCNLFYTWQYDIRWAATKLRHRGVMRAADESPVGVWELASGWK